MFDFSLLGMALVGGLMFVGSATALKKRRGGKRRGVAKGKGTPGTQKLKQAMRAERPMGSKRKKKLDEFIDDRLDEM